MKADSLVLSLAAVRDLRFNLGAMAKCGLRYGLILAVYSSLVSGASATIILDQPVIGGPGDHGNYQGAYWQLSDPGFSVTGGPVPQTTDLESVTMTYEGATGVEAEVPLYLKVFSGNAGGLGTFVGISANSVLAFGSTPGTLLTWTFNDLPLDKDTTYSYIVGTTNDSTPPTDLISLHVSDDSDPLSTGDLLSGNAVADHGYDPTLVITLASASVPEPSSILLLTSGLLGLWGLVRRNRKGT